MSDFIAVASLIGPFSIALMLGIMGILSFRLGRVMHAAPYYIGFYVAAALLAGAGIIRIVRLAEHDTMPHNAMLIYYILVASGVTLGLVVAWRYWSWLLAERD